MRGMIPYTTSVLLIPVLVRHYISGISKSGLRTNILTCSMTHSATYVKLDVSRADMSLIELTGDFYSIWPGSQIEDMLCDKQINGSHARLVDACGLVGAGIAIVYCLFKHVL